MTDESLHGKRAFVTGGGRGIGQAIARALAAQGASILVGYVRNAAAAEKTVEEIRAAGGTADAVRGHLGDEEKVKRLFEEVGEHSGYLDILINNAASGVNRAAMDLTAHHWDWTLNINARAAWLCAQQAAPLMAGRSGKIVNISSLGSNRVMADYFAVGVSKAALEAVTRYLAVELAPRDISVNAVSGGLVETDALKSFSWGKEAVEKMRERTPAGRIVEPDDIAHAVLFLCSEKARMIRGQTLVVDGGLSLLI